MTVIAIDGPSGSGKSTVARLVAERLQMAYLDTGAMYRCVGLSAIHRGLSFSDAEAMTKIAAEMKLQLLDQRVKGELKPRVVLNGVDVTSEIRSLEATNASSAVAVHADVREKLVGRQQRWVEEAGSAVVEGRDIGTVVFPNADLKIFLTASDDVRTRRRQLDENSAEFAGMSAADVRAAIDERDVRDSTRDASPLQIAPDAVVIDATNLDVEDIAMEIMLELRKRFSGELPMGNRK